jgi:PAS domain S-box-containing protein
MGVWSMERQLSDRAENQGHGPEAGTGAAGGALGVPQPTDNFWARLLDTLALRLLVLDENLRILYANRAYWQERSLQPGEVIGRPLYEVFPAELLHEAGLEGAVRLVLDTGQPTSWEGYRIGTEDHPERIVDIRLAPLPPADGQRQVLMTITDVTQQQRQLYELALLHEIMRAMLHEAGGLPRLLYAILSGMTAGRRCGLGFNRAFILLTDETGEVLRGEMALGPASVEEAYRIWTAIGDNYCTLADFIHEFDRMPPRDQWPLAGVLEQMVFSMQERQFLPVLALAEGQTIHVTHASSDPRVPPRLRELLGVEEFVVAPLQVERKPIGVAMADNFVTRQPLREGDLRLVTTLANLAAVAIDSARARERERQQTEQLKAAYQALERTQQELVASKQLAAIGEIAAIVAHEIRNPLSVIGGFARLLARNPQDPQRVERNSRIILDEVERLEKILSDLLEMARPRPPQRRPTDLAALVETVAEGVRASLAAAPVELVVETEPHLPYVLLDPDQFRQVLTNLIDNGLDAMPEGGRLTLRVRRHGEGVALDVADTGIGIPEDRLHTIWEAFVTTKPSGTGLGLALTRTIVIQHEAELSVQSRVGEGTVFTVYFPPALCLRPEPEAQYESSSHSPHS